MRINRKWLRIILIIIALLSLAVALLYVNNLISYKNEVKPAQAAHKPLNPHQQQILTAIILNKIEFGACLFLLIIAIVVKNFEPKFGEAFTYYGD